MAANHTEENFLTVAGPQVIGKKPSPPLHTPKETSDNLKCNRVLELRYLVGVWFRLLWDAASNCHFRCTLHLSVFLFLSVLLFFGAHLPMFLCLEKSSFDLPAWTPSYSSCPRPLVTSSSEKHPWCTFHPLPASSSFPCLFSVWPQQAPETGDLILRVSNSVSSGLHGALRKVFWSISESIVSDK